MEFGGIESEKANLSKIIIHDFLDILVSNEL